MIIARFRKNSKGKFESFFEEKLSNVCKKVTDSEQVQALAAETVKT